MKCQVIIKPLSPTRLRTLVGDFASNEVSANSPAPGYKNLAIEPVDPSTGSVDPATGPLNPGIRPVNLVHGPTRKSSRKVG